MTTDLSDISLAILAGGEGSRMGQPKGHLRVGGQPILAYLHARFTWPGPVLLITAPGREHPPGWELFDQEWVDPVAGQGPLRGVLTARSRCQTPGLIVTTVDMPEMHFHHFQWLAEIAAGEKKFAITLLQRANDSKTPDLNPRIEPFPSLYHASAMELIASRLSAGDASMRGLAKHPSVRVCPAPADWDDRTWTNLNRPSDVQAWVQE